MNSYRLSLGGGQQAANRTSEPFYAVWNLESHPGTILGNAYKSLIKTITGVCQQTLVWEDFKKKE